METRQKVHYRKGVGKKGMRERKRTMMKMGGIWRRKEYEERREEEV